jgi:integrase
MARPQKPHHQSWDNRPVVGLYRCPDGRWRINATGEKFTCHDEREAIRRFRHWEQQQAGMQVLIPRPPVMPEEMGPFDYKGEPRPRPPHSINSTDFWPWLRELFLNHPEYLAEQMALPQLLNIRHMDMPRPGLKLTELIRAYKEKNPSTPKAKARCVAIFEKLIDHSGARTLDDLTAAALERFKLSVEQSKDIRSAGTKTWMFGQVKAMLSFGLKVGLDQQQIRAALDRCRVLWTADAPPPMQPKPISKEDFHKLLHAAGGGPWRAWLLLGLNAALYLEELCAAKWAELDLDDCVYCTIRNKTKTDRIPRAATLWEETIAALRSLPRGPVYVFTSAHGTRFASSNARANAFADLRERAGVAKEIGFSSLKDAAYSIACQSAPDERLARVLAGHRAPGLLDNYVLRHPEVVRPACDAIYRAYGPFPPPSDKSIAG